MPISYRAAQTLIKRGDEVALRTALEQGLDHNLANQKGWTLLHLAAVEGSVPLARLLVEKGANLAALNHAGGTAHTIASNRGYVAFVEFLSNPN